MFKVCGWILLDFWISRKLLFLVLNWKIDTFLLQDFNTKLEGSDEVSPQYQITGYLEKLFGALRK